MSPWHLPALLVVCFELLEYKEAIMIFKLLCTNGAISISAVIEHIMDTRLLNLTCSQFDTCSHNSCHTREEQFCVCISQTITYNTGLIFQQIPNLPFLALFAVLWSAFYSHQSLYCPILMSYDILPAPPRNIWWSQDWHVKAILLLCSQISFERPTGTICTGCMMFLWHCFFSRTYASCIGVPTVTSSSLYEIWKVWKKGLPLNFSRWCRIPLHNTDPIKISSMTWMQVATLSWRLWDFFCIASAKNWEKCLQSLALNSWAVTGLLVKVSECNNTHASHQICMMRSV